MSLAHPRPEPVRRIAVLAFGFAASQLRRQPWAAVHGLATTLAADGTRVWVLTDVHQHGLEGHGPYEVVHLPQSFVRNRPHPALEAWLAATGVDELWLLCGLFQLLRLRAVPRRVRLVPLLLSPRLRVGEVLAAWLRAGPAERRMLRLPLINALIPTKLLARRLAQLGIRQIVYGSPTSRTRLVRRGLPMGPVLPPPLPTPLHQAPTPAPTGDGPLVVGFGPALAARGADLVVRIFERACARGFPGRLELLLRPDCPRTTARLLRRIRKSPVAARIRAETRRLSPTELQARIAAADAILLPFRAPIAELPLVVFEAAASGRPVLVLDRPGIGDWGRLLGLVVARRPQELAEALLRHETLPRPRPRPLTDPLAGLPPAVAARLLRLRLFALAGPDGVGKTTLAQALARHLAPLGLAPRVRWRRWTHRLSRPLCLLLRLMGRSRLVARHGVRLRLRDARRPRWFARLFLYASALDLALDLLTLRLARGLVVGDRSVVDALVDLALETGLEEQALALARPLLRLHPRPFELRLLLRPPAEVLRRRPDVAADPFLFARHRLYRRLADRLVLPVVAVDDDVTVTLGRLLQPAGEVP